MQISSRILNDRKFLEFRDKICNAVQKYNTTNYKIVYGYDYIEFREKKLFFKPIIATLEFSEWYINISKNIIEVYAESEHQNVICRLCEEIEKNTEFEFVLQGEYSPYRSDYC